MSREYQPTGHHKPGRKPGGKKNPKPAQYCECGKDAMRMGGDNCARCGKLLPDYEV